MLQPQLRIRGLLLSTAIESLGFVTRGRPAALLRALDGFARNVKDGGRACTLIVADDSIADADRDANAQVLADVGRRFDLATRYIGRAEKQRLASALARATAVPRDLLDFALFGDARVGCTVGANRNALLLSCAGARFACSDDDMVARVVAAHGPAESAIWLSPQDPCAFRFYPSRKAALDAEPPCDADIVGLYERGLGARTDDGARVVAAFLGIHGDCGFESPAALLYGTSDESRARMIAAEETYRIAMTSREILRVVPRPTMARPMPFFGGAMALDARGLLPPFMPVLRNEDGLFGRTIGFMDARAFCFHLPYAVLHAPEERGPYATTLLRAAHGSRFCELVLAAFVCAPPSDAVGAARLRDFGASLEALGALAPSDFAHEKRALLRRVASAKQGKLRALLEASGGRPAYWAHDASEYLRELDRAVASGTLFALRELGEREDEANAHARDLVRRLGALYGVWDALFDAAATFEKSAPGGRVR